MNPRPGAPPMAASIETEPALKLRESGEVPLEPWNSPGPTASRMNRPSWT
jgi:hypothetical protein